MVHLKFDCLKRFKKIFVLISGGIDSTYLYEIIKKWHGNRVYPVNCYNPYENSDTLKQIKNLDPNFIQIFPSKNLNYKKILREAFLNLPKALELKKQGKYHKKIFGCCYYIKHKAFLSHPMFKEEGTVVVSGIKRGDGKQRRIFLSQLRNGTFKTLPEKKPTFFLKHRTGQLYFYPFRDYNFKELPKITMNRLRKKYPNLKHSGCKICPVLLLFNEKSDMSRYEKSKKYAQNLGLDVSLFLN